MTGTAPPHPSSAGVIDDLLRTTARIHPGAAAIGPLAAAIDFRTLDTRVSRIAAGLGREGKPGDRVAILGRNSAVQVELLFGCFRAGQVALPINWRLNPAEIAYILGHSGATRLFADRSFASVLAAIDIDLPILFLDDEGADGFAVWRDAQPLAIACTEPRPEQVALQMYTSGTTGLPKGVMLTHANVMASIAAFSTGAMALGPDDVIYAPAPMFHITGIGPVLRSAQSGARLVVDAAFKPTHAVQLMANERVSYTTLAPAMIQAALSAPTIADADLSALRLIVYGGSPIAPDVLAEAQARLRCEFVQCYGLTEATGPVTILAPEDHRAGDALLLSCGRAAQGIDIMVADAMGTPLAPGETGEILLRGDVVMAGYAADPAATLDVLRDGWLRTGDAGYLDSDGYLFIRDRVKDMIVSGGENIYPVEVENALRAHPGVQDVAVIGVPDNQWGEAVAALVVPALDSPQAAGGEALIAFCHTRIAGFKCPKWVRFIDTIPRNAAGKILRRELRAPFWEGQSRWVG